MKFIMISPKNRTVYNFRGELIKDIISKGHEVTATGPDDDNLNEIKELGIRFERVPLHKDGVNLLEDMRYLSNLFRLFRREKPDVILGYTIKPVIYGSIAAKLAGVKNINSLITGIGYVFASDTFKAKFIKFFASTLYRTGLRCSDTVIFQNKDDMRLFLELKLVNQKKCRLVNGSGVNMDKFKKVDLPKEISFFMLGRLIHLKGVKEYLEAAKIVKRKYPKVKFMLLGAVENQPDSIKPHIVQSYVDEGIIEYIGETNDVTDFYKKSSIFVLPSYREGLPRSILEAMATGRPIITTDVPGCRETVLDGINGFLVPAKDIQNLVERMIYFILNPEKIKEMGENSHKLCYKKFEVNKVNRIMLNHMDID